MKGRRERERERKRKGKEEERKGEREREIGSEALAETEKIANAPAGNRTRKGKGNLVTYINCTKICLISDYQHFNTTFLQSIKMLGVFQPK